MSDSDGKIKHCNTLLEVKENCPDKGCENKCKGHETNSIEFRGGKGPIHRCSFIPQFLYSNFLAVHINNKLYFLKH